MLALFLIVLFVAVVLLLLEIAVEVLAILLHSIEVELLVLALAVGGVCVALLRPRLPIEHAIEVHVHARILSLQLAQHVLDVAHDSLDVDEVRVLTITILLLLLLLLLVRVVRVLLLLGSAISSVHVRVSERLRRVSARVVARPSWLLLLLGVPPSRLSVVLAVAISLVVRVTWVRLLIRELLVELGCYLLDIVVGLNVVMGPVVYQFVTVLLVALIVVLLLPVHARASLEASILIASCAHLDP